MKKLLVFVVLVAAALAGAAFYESKLEERDAKSFTAAGKLVDVGGRKLHVLCAGQGAPTVVFESSGLSPALEWEKLVAEVGKKQRACAYDRAGMGWSDPVDGERAITELVADTRAALTAAGEKPPYVLVGHSIGGALVRQYVASHPDEVRGLVLVDVATKYVMERWPKVGKAMRSNLSRGRWLATVGLLRLANPLKLDARDAALTYRARTMVAADQVVGAGTAALPTLPASVNVPTVVLTHGRGGDWAGPGVIGPVDEAAIEYDWQAAQKELAHDLKAPLVVADKSGHMIASEQPELIVQAIEKVSAPPAPPAATAQAPTPPPTAK
jgi:pimeloyl-ACP methyl ester carboxylesterase